VAPIVAVLATDTLAEQHITRSAREAKATRIINTSLAATFRLHRQS
jgi:hypothetical protein